MWVGIVGATRLKMQHTAPHEEAPHDCQLQLLNQEEGALQQRPHSDLPSLTLLQIAVDCAACSKVLHAAFTNGRRTPPVVL